MSTAPLPTTSKTPSPQDGGPSFGLRNRLVRLVWGVVWLLLASWTPAPLHPWRRALLRLFGARMGHRADVRGSSRVWLPSHLVMADHALIGPKVTCYNQAPITLGERALVSQGAHLCAGTHDIDRADFPLVAKPIVIGAHAWVAAEAFVGPGAVIGEGCVLGARAVAFGRLDDWGVYAGNPARRVRERRWRSPGSGAPA
ncbi:MAG: putative colanic acid biosynthesis acetyltransferase [Burkholderiales bacterium]|nr:putative colanic acid biosynthesis acetyltransferase [Burkholderiales bacterium]MBH2015024.1 putative colanic acid biosynthesis acetyltransferase [Burkholderiales bacterium]